LISALARNQFIASQFALLTAFLPAFLLSGFLFEISSMPSIIQALTHVVSARWFVQGLQTVFLAGDLWPLLLKDIAALLALGIVFIGLSIHRSSGTLDK
jgi:ABC-2 type transport system permease protein